MKDEIQAARSSRTQLNQLVAADDTMLIAENKKKDLQPLLDIGEEESRKKGLELISEKQE